MAKTVRLRVNGYNARRYLGRNGYDTHFAHRTLFDMKDAFAVLGLLEIAINIRAIRHPAQDATPYEVGNIIVLRTRLQDGCFHTHLGVVSTELSHHADDVGGVVHKTERQVIPALFVILRNEFVIRIGLG